MRENTQVADFSVVTSEQSKFIKPVDTAVLSMVAGGDPHLITNLNEFLRTGEPK